MALIVLAIVVLFGPDKLPSIARDLGAGVRKMRGAVDDIKTEIMKEADNPVSDIKKEIDKIKDSAKDYNPLNNLEEELNNTAPKELTENKPLIKPSEDDTYEGPVRR